jgi:mannose-1-phosphate guanylyltransferase / phosphomannomutase
MHALILADRLGHELWPLTDKRPISLLPIANKPVLQLTIEELFQLGVRKAAIVSALHAELVSTYFGSGQALGMELKHIAVDTPCSVEEGLRLAGSDLSGEWVAVRGDILRPFGFLLEALARGAKAAASSVFTTMGIALPGPGGTVSSDIRWQAVQACGPVGPCHLLSLHDYHQANMLAVQGEVPDFILPGRPTEQHIAIGQQAVVLAQPLTRRTIIGRHCLVDGNVVLADGAIVGDGSIVDKGALIKESVILPGSYVGAMQVERSIVDGTRIFDCDSGAIMDLSGSSLAGLNLRHPHAEFAMT